MRTPQGPDQGVRPTRPQTVYTMTRCGVRAVLERLPEVFPIEALSRGAQRIEQKHVVHGHLFAWGARIKEHSADPNQNIYTYTRIRTLIYICIYIYIQAQTCITFMQSLPDEGLENVYIYTPLRTYTHL